MGEVHRKQPGVADTRTISERTGVGRVGSEGAAPRGSTRPHCCKGEIRAAACSVLEKGCQEICYTKAGHISVRPIRAALPSETKMVEICESLIACLSPYCHCHVNRRRWVQLEFISLG